MLKLKKLEILGFKSFCDRTEVRFQGEGIAAIVGPNGCGKSNISDAITWVLGEQSAKTLRGSRMEDVIFAGTRDRKPTGMAEVSLTLIDPQVYDGNPADLTSEMEVDVRDELHADDWDEAELRAKAAEETERVSQELQPGLTDGDEAEESAEASADVEASAEAQSEAQHESAATEAVAVATDASLPGPKEVVLKVRRRKFKPMALKKGEIVVTRRLFRSGDSEYLLNGKICRLRDIQDIFMGTGLGPESYAIIEQGRIGQILSSKPTDRRAIIEEAAGITKFKTKKRLAELRLEAAKQNLARVNDIFDEVTRQMNSLKRQAAKAERYAKLRDEMREKLRVVLASKFAQFAEEATALDAQITALAAELQTKSEAVQQMEVEQGELTQRGYALENEAQLTRERVNGIVLEIDRAGARQRHNEERCAELTARAAGADAEIAQTSVQLESLNAELQTNRDVLASAAADVAAAEAETQQRQQDASAAVSALAELERMQELSRRQLMEAVGRASGLRNQITQAEEHIAGLDREAFRLTNEKTAALADLESFGSKRGQLTMEFETASQKLDGVNAQLADTKSRLDGARMQETDTKRKLDGLRSAMASASGKRSSLEAVIAEHGYSTESVKRLLQSGITQNFTPVGVLADFLEVEDKYETVVEDFLRDELNYIVVKSWDSADEGLRMLRGDVDGRATFLVHPNDAQARFSFAVDESARPQTRTDAVVPLKNCIRVLNGFGKSLEVVLPKLGDGYITPDSSTARDLALGNPNAYFLSPSGECFHNVTVTGGKQRSEGPLSLKRELRDVLRMMSDLEHEIGQEEAKLVTLAREIEQLTGLQQRLEEERRECEKVSLTSGHTLRQLDSEIARIHERVSTYERELARVAGEKQDKQTLIGGRQQELATAEQQREEIERTVAEAQTRAEELRVARDTAVQNAATASARLAGLEERRKAAAAALGRIEALVTEVSARIENLRSQIAAANAEKLQRETETQQLAERLVTLATEKSESEKKAEELHQQAEQTRARLGEIEQQVRAARTELDAARDRRGELAATRAKLESDTQHLGETCITDMGCTAEELRAQEIPLVAGEQLAIEDAAYREMRSRLDAMGPVNMMALEEYNETSQRHAFLETQRKDLLDSIENTTNTIKEIDEFSRQRFTEAFEKINENFQITFRKLFGGGQGFMRLTDEENANESGIDIVASPPGKKLQNVLLLSGGEKALTAFALLVGIFQYQPSPFCILDEVDAPLDEANVGRFTELVREMAVQTQFVIITHSKKTMSIAPVMYGVTMQEPGVSKLVSVKFEAVKQAATA